MNILYTNFHYGNGGGHTTYVLALLRNREHTCYVACPASSRLYRMLREQGFGRLVDMTFPGKLGQIAETVKNARRLARFVQENDIDIVHTNGSGDNRLALYASLLCKKKFKVVYTKHNTIQVKGRISRWRLNKFNDAVILVAQSVIAAAGLNPTGRYHVIENGIDVEHWSRREEPRSGERIRLVSNAGTGRAKGWYHLIEAMNLLPEADRERLSVVVMGRDDTFLMEKIDEIKRHYDFTHTGYLDDPRPTLEQGDVGFILSYREACSFATREMMSMSLPVLSSDFAGSERDVIPGTGWITRMKDPESIRDALRAILDLPPEELTAMKRAARERAVAAFSIEKMIAETNKVYAGLLPEKARAESL